jgi:hypothetical protein
MSDRDHEDDIAELFEQFFEEVSYRGAVRGFSRFARGLQPGPAGAHGEIGDARAQVRQVSPDGAARAQALPPRPNGQLPAPLVRRRGRRPKNQQPMPDPNVEKDGQA